MKLKMVGGGGDSIDYDALTATAAKVGEGYKFIGAGSEDIQTGTMPDMAELNGDAGYSDDNTNIPIHNSEDTGWTTDTQGNLRIVMSPGHGEWPGGSGAYVGCTPAELEIDAAKIASGESIAGTSGTYSSDATATANDIRSGRVAYAKGERVTGSLNDNGSVSKTLTAGESMTLNGIYTGKVTAKDLSSQTSATATAAGILYGMTAWVSGLKIIGSMTNNGAVSQNLNAGGTYSIPRGFHNGSGKVTANSLASQTSGTAAAADILSGKTAWVGGSKVTGRMTDNSGTTKSATATLDTTNSRLQLTIPTVGKYSAASKLYATYSTIRTLIGLTAAKIASGNTILGLAGTFSSNATATAARILSGYTACVNGSEITGTMPDNTTRTSNGSVPGINSSYTNVPTREGTSPQLHTATDGTSRFNICPPQGYYQGGGGSYVNCTASEVATVIGLTAAKLKKGQTVLGITGSGVASVGLISAIAARGFDSSSGADTPNEASFTVPSGSTGGTVYYGGFSAGNSGAVTQCRIYKNGEIVDSRDISGGNYAWRSTMVNKSFSVSAGDVIRVYAAASSGSNAMAFIQAVINYYT